MSKKIPRAKQKARILKDLLLENGHEGTTYSMYTKDRGYDINIPIADLDKDIHIPSLHLNKLFEEDIKALREPILLPDAYEQLYELIENYVNKEMLPEEDIPEGPESDDEPMAPEDPDPSIASSSHSLRADPGSIDLSELDPVASLPRMRIRTREFARDPAYPTFESEYGRRYDEATILRILQGIDNSLIPLDRDVRAQLQYPMGLEALLKQDERIARVFYKGENDDSYEIICFMLSLDTAGQVVQGPQFIISLNKNEVERSGISPQDIPKAIRKVMGSRSLFSRLRNQKREPYKMAAFINRGDILEQYKRRKNLGQRPSQRPSDS